jgi:nucleoside 2-deoxyribosyltransferase
VAYRFTGEDPKVLEPLLTAIRDGLQENGVDSYSSFFDEAEFQDKSMTARQIMDHAFSIINDIDFLFVVQTSESKSEGMLMEVGYCIAKGIPIVVANKKGITGTYVPQMAEQVMVWESVEDLTQKIQASDFKKFSKKLN